MDVLVVFELFRRVFPLAPGEPGELPISDAETKRFERLAMFNFFWIFLATPVVIYLLFLNLYEAAQLSLPVADGAILVAQDSVFWLLPSVFLGLMTSVMILQLLLRMGLRRGYPRLVRYYSETMRFDVMKVMWASFVIVLLGSSLWFVWGIHSFSRFSQRGIELGNPPFFAVTFHPYDDVLAIEQHATFVAPNGNQVARPHLVIQFKGGTSWTSRTLFGEPNVDRDRELANLVSQHSGLPVVNVP